MKTFTFSKRELSVLLLLIALNLFSQGTPSLTRLFNPSSNSDYGHIFVRHLNLEKHETYVSAIGSVDFFGTTTNAKTRFISRLGIDGIPKWTAKFYPDKGQMEKNIANDFACVDKNDNFLILFNPDSNVSSFVDGIGNNFSFPNSPTKILMKLDKNGSKIWSKEFFNASFTAAITTDSFGDVYVVGNANSATTIEGYTLDKLFIIKLEGTTGNIQYVKAYNNVYTYDVLPSFDTNNNLYIFTEVYTNDSSTHITFDNVTISNNESGNNIMLKFDSSGNCVWGKNFHSGNPDYSYTWFTDILFDGVDFIAMGSVYSPSSQFLGLDDLVIPKIYPLVYYHPILFKIKTDGSVTWQKPISTSKDNQGNYTNTDLDENKNIYGYYNIREKMTIGSTEYNYDATIGSKILFKFDNNGNLTYLKDLDSGPTTGRIDVIKEDIINCYAMTTTNNILNYPISNSNTNKFYIATLGNLETKYMTPESNYNVLTNIQMPNNPNNANIFNFRLINNVLWNVNSNQNWLNLSSQNLIDKSTQQSNINGNGDAIITLTAETNNTGSERSANILITSNDTSSSTIIVTQTAVLANEESKLILTSIFPNPTSNSLNIKTVLRMKKIEIYDLSGKLLKTHNQNLNKIPVDNLTRGNYLIKIYAEDRVLESKFIKE